MSEGERFVSEGEDIIVYENVRAAVLAMRALGGKGSGWHREQGHVPGSQGGETQSARARVEAMPRNPSRASEIDVPKVMNKAEGDLPQYQSADITSRETKYVSIRDLTPTQNGVEASTVLKRLDDARGKSPIEVVESGGRYFIAEGHHRVISAIARKENNILATVSFVPVHRALGGKGSGNHGHAGRRGRKGGSGSGGGAQLNKVRNERSLRALKAFIPIHAGSQRHAENNELSVRNMIGGDAIRTDDNLPVDVIATIGGKKKGIEVKTMINNTNDKITMRKAAIQKKDLWGRKNHASVHTVVIDDRGKLGNKGYSGHRLYYAKGSGSFRVNSMTKVQDAQHLKDLLQK